MNAREGVFKMDDKLEINRRTMLKTIAAAGLGTALPPAACAAEIGKHALVVSYLESLARPGSGYAWEDQEQSHLTPTFAVIGCYQLLNELPPAKARLAEFVRTHHPGQLKKLEQERRLFEFQQVQALVWLGEDAGPLREKVRSWSRPVAYLKQYEQHGYPLFQSECAVFACRKLLDLPRESLAPAFVEYLDARRRANGSFNNTPAADGGDGHVLNTLWGLQALQTLDRLAERRDETIAWLQGCALPENGFTYQPKPAFAGSDDVAYTRAALRGLQLLGAPHAQGAACIDYLHSLANADGGFGDRPGWNSNPVATYYALDALNTLGAMDSLAAIRRRRPSPPPALPRELKVFSIQIEAHGTGSPAEAVDLAGSLGIHLWGAKNAQPAWITRAQAIADRRRVPVRFFVADEEYGTWISVAGLGTYSHTSDIIAPAGSSFGKPLSDHNAVTWPVFRERRRAPLVQAGGRLIWQFGENEELTRLYLDDSLERGGYAAISTFHFGNPDFTNSDPFLCRWKGQLPYVALQDAHGREPWWFADMTAGFRTLFLALEPTWEHWLQALDRNWVVAVRHDAASGSKTWFHAGSRAVLERVREHEDAWRWWDNSRIARPLVSLVPVYPDDEFEVARPKQGVTLRVRCAWENTTQGLPKRPIVELARLSVDGIEVQPSAVTVEDPGGTAIVDRYHAFPVPELPPGRHKATAVVRVLETKAELTRTIEFGE